MGDGVIAYDYYPHNIDRAAVAIVGAAGFAYAMNYRAYFTMLPNFEGGIGKKVLNAEYLIH